jgi:alpha-galactosidase
LGNKVTIIGGGSSIFVPALIRGFIASPIMDGGRVTLMDVNESRVRVMEALARRLIDSEGVDLAVEQTLDQRASLRDADYVIVAISVGGIAAWENDIEIPGRYGVFGEVADSTGPGGIMRAFRNAPVLASIARDVAEVAPGAGLV